MCLSVNISRYHVHGTPKLEQLQTTHVRQALENDTRAKLPIASLVIVGSGFYCVIVVSLQHKPASVLIRSLRPSDLDIFENSSRSVISHSKPQCTYVDFDTDDVDQN